MELVWFALFFAIFIIFVLKSQTEILEEDKHFLREDNISLRSDLKKALFRMENIHSNQNWQKEWVGVKEKIKKKKPMKGTKKRDRIFIFEDAKSEKDAEKLVSFRDFLKGNSISEVVLVEFETLALKLSDEDDDSVIEEIFILDDNPDNLPIIFYGGDPEDFLSFLCFFEWHDRVDMEWIEDPWDIDDLKEVIEELRES